MATSEKSSETTSTKRVLKGYDLINGVRLVGEPALAISPLAVINPVSISLEKVAADGEGADAKGVRIAATPVLFTSGSIYFVSENALMGHYTVQDESIHAVYEQSLKGGGEANASGSDSASE